MPHDLTITLRRPEGAEPPGGFKTRPFLLGLGLALGLGAACDEVVITPATGSSAASSSGGGACDAPADCTPSDNPCLVTTCDEGTCGVVPAAAGTPCSSGEVCDGAGLCLGCIEDADCPSGSSCIANTCQLGQCVNGIKDADETDIDCGGSICPPCPKPTPCLMSTDCESGYCKNGICVPNTMIISEVRTHGANGDGFGDEFVELYNPGSIPIVLDASFQLLYMNAQGGCQGPEVRFTGSGQVVPPKHHFLIVGLSYQQSPSGDAQLENVSPSASIGDAAGMFIERAGTIEDALCFYYDASTLATLNGACSIAYPCEGTPVSNLPHNGTDFPASASDASLERKPGGAMGNAGDTDDNAVDFAPRAPADPQNLASPPTP